MHSSITAALRLLGIAVWMLVLLGPIAVLLALHKIPACRWLVRVFWKGMVRLLGITVVVRGDLSRLQPTLFVANHISYFDIAALGSVLPGAFIAKSEVGLWPMIGALSKLGNTVFIDRRRRTATADQRDQLMSRLVDDRESLILFPEGTSTDGARVLPFKSALFAAAKVAAVDGRPLPVQPVTIAYTRLDGIPLGRGWRPFFAWYGDMELASHAWMALGLGRLTVEIDLHPTVRLDGFSSRKALADHCHDVIRTALVTANAGRAVARPAATGTAAE